MKKEVAVTCYIDNNINTIDEFRWLYNSWLKSGSWLMSDIVAFHHPQIQEFMLPKDNNITYIPLMPHIEKYPEWNNYSFINSIGYLTEPEAKALAKYKYILRTDCDCFLTPYFSTLKPRLTMFGAGQYASEPDVAIKLMSIAKEWGIKPAFNNIGSTVFGETQWVLIYSSIHLEYCKRLSEEAFKDGNGVWPGWYRGVLSMYAGQLAAQSYFGLAMTIGGLDVHCVAHEDISPQDYHIHAWHSFDHFSKFKWRKGEYVDYDMGKVDKTKIADYCLWIAGFGRQPEGEIF